MCASAPGAEPRRRERVRREPDHEAGHAPTPRPAPHREQHQRHEQEVGAHPRAPEARPDVEVQGHEQQQHHGELKPVGAGRDHRARVSGAGAGWRAAVRPGGAGGCGAGAASAGARRASGRRGGPVPARSSRGGPGARATRRGVPADRGERVRPAGSGLTGGLRHGVGDPDPVERIEPLRLERGVARERAREVAAAA